MKSADFTVLVVDDNPATRYSTSRVLRAEGFNLREAGTGNDALRLADERVDLVVLDINLPDLSGFEICQTLRERPDTARVAIVHLSASFVDEGSKVTGLNAGADGYLTHPVEPRVLVATVKAFLRARKAEAEREQLLESERAARAEAERANRLKDEFLATLSHELRTPLNAILGWAEVLARQTQGSDHKQGLQAIERNARLQAQLINDLLDVSRITSGKMRLDIELLDLNAALETAIEGVRSTAEAKGVRLECAGEAAHAMVLADGARIQQVLWNLLSNAIKFTPRGGNVRAEVHSDEHQVRVVITDSGRGIEPEFLPHIFDRFRQGESGSARAAGGLGLGLSIVKHLVEMHGGSVTAYSSGKGEGATFSVLLPATALLPDAEQAATLSVQSSFASDHSLSGLRVLVVEDDDDARILVGRVLGEAGAEVLECGEVDTALARLDDFAPQVLVSDIGMSPRDGYELIRKIRSSGIGAAQLPAVALTAFARMEDRRSVLLAGYQMHLAKPADPQELVAAVASLAGRTGNRTR